MTMADGTAGSAEIKIPMNGSLSGTWVPLEKWNRNLGHIRKGDPLSGDGVPIIREANH